MRALLPATAAVAAVALSCAARAEVVVGVAVPSAGPKLEVGRHIQTAAGQEIAKLNAAGGAGGETVALRIEDDDCTAEGGAAVAARFVAAKAAIILGHPCSNAAIAAAKVYAAANMLFVAIGASHPDLTVKRAGPTIFRYGGRDDRQAADTASEIVRLYPGRKIAVVHDRTAYARGLAEGVHSGLKRAGAVVVALEGIVASEKDYGGVIARLKASGASLVYFAGFPAEAEIVFKQARAAGLNAVFVGCEAITPDALADQPSEGATGNAVIVRRPPGDLAVVIRAWVASSGTGAFSPQAFSQQAFSQQVGFDAAGDIGEPSFMAIPSGSAPPVR